MARKIDRPVTHNAPLAVTPQTLATVPVGANGQLAVVTDQGAVNLMVRKGGSLVPAVDVATTVRDETIEEMTFTVNSDTGVSPATSVRIRSQAEFTALGSPLRYIHDVFDILQGVTVMYPINVLLDGTAAHGAKPGSCGPVYLGYEPIIGPPTNGSWGRGPSYFGSDFSKLRWFGGINFEGVGEVEIEASQGGVISGTAGKYLTRDLGTWIVNEHRGRLVRIDSGIGAGSYAVVVANTTTELETVSYSLDAGSCNFSIIEPKTVIADTANHSGVYNFGSSWGGYITFFNLKFGTVAQPSSIQIFINTTPSYYIANCMFVTRSFQFDAASQDGYVRCDISSIRLVYDPNYISAVWLKSCTFFPWGTLIYSTDIDRPLVDMEAAYFYWERVAVLAPSGMSAGVPLVRIGQGMSRIYGDFADGMRLRGNGVCDLIQVLGDLVFGYSVYATIISMRLENAANAIVVDGGKVTFPNNLTISGTSALATGWRLLDGGQVFVNNPADIGGTTNIVIDGETKTYVADMANPGDVINGRYGSRFVRRVA